MSDGRSKNLGLVTDLKTGEPIGQHPDDISEADLLALGHKPTSLLACIRARCIDCSGGSPGEARKCISQTCPLWPYRMGKRPAVRRRSELGAAARAARSPSR